MIRMDMPLIILSWFWKTSQWAGEWEVAPSVLRSAIADPGEHGGRSIIVTIEHSPHEKDHHLE